MAFWKRSAETPSIEVKPEQSSILTDLSEVRGMIERCCEQSLPATIMFMASGQTCRCRFTSLETEAIVMTLPDDFDKSQIDQHLPPLTPCVVIFLAGARSRVFMSSVVATRDKLHEVAPPQVTVRFPQFVAGTDLRMAFRVPITNDTGVVVRVTDSSGASSSANAVDLSLTGMLIEFSSEKDPAYPVDSEVRVELSLESTSAALRGVVRRRTDRRYGIYFPDVFRGVEIQPPAELRAIMNAVERRWLRARAK